MFSNHLLKYNTINAYSLITIINNQQEHCISHKVCFMLREYSFQYRAETNRYWLAV